MLDLSLFVGFKAHIRISCTLWMKRILVVLNNNINYMCEYVFISIISFSEERCPSHYSTLCHIRWYTMALTDTCDTKHHNW